MKLYKLQNTLLQLLKICMETAKYFDLLSMEVKIKRAGQKVSNLKSM